MHSARAGYHHHRLHRPQHGRRLGRPQRGFRQSRGLRCRQVGHDQGVRRRRLQRLLRHPGRDPVHRRPGQGNARGWPVDGRHGADLHVGADGHSVGPGVLHVVVREHQSAPLRAAAGLGLVLRHRPDPVLLHRLPGYGRARAGRHPGRERGRDLDQHAALRGNLQEARFAGSALLQLHRGDRALAGRPAGGLRAGRHAVDRRRLHVDRGLDADPRSVQALPQSDGLARHAEAVRPRGRVDHRAQRPAGRDLLA